MGTRPRIERTPEEKWQIVHEGIKSGNVSETCRRYEISLTLFYRWKDEAEQGVKAAPRGKRCRGGNGKRPSHPAGADARNGTRTPAVCAGCLRMTTLKQRPDP